MATALGYETRSESVRLPVVPEGSVSSSPTNRRRPGKKGVFRLNWLFVLLKQLEEICDKTFLAGT